MVLNQLEKDWGSHLPVLIKLMAKTTGNVLEVGTGVYSTPFLHWACFLQGRTLVSVENSEEYMDFAKKFETDFHKIEKQIPENEWSIVFIDSFPLEERINISKKVANQAQYVIVHDSDRVQESYEGIFKYNFNYTKCPYSTSIFSNFINVEEETWQ